MTEYVDYAYSCWACYFIGECSLFKDNTCPKCGCKSLEVLYIQRHEEKVPVEYSGLFRLYSDRLCVVEDGKGRVYDEYDVNIDFCLQDDGKTLKLFISKKENK